MTINDPRVHPHLCEAFPAILPAPAYELTALRTWLHTWLVDMGLLTSSDVWHRIDGWRMPEFAAMFYPYCKTMEDAQLCCAWVTWLHYFDDQFDQPRWSRCLGHAQAVIDAYLEFTSAARGSTIRVSDDPVMVAFGELITRIVTPMSISWRNRFFDLVDIWLCSYVVETAHRSSGIILEPRRLVLHKRTCMAVPPCCEVLERVTSGELPTDLRNLLIPIVDLICDITGAVNDIVSFEREQLSDSKHNLVLSIMDKRRIDRVTASNQVRQMIDVWVDDLRHVMDTYPLNPVFHHHNDALHRWMAGCQAMVRGYYEWTLDTARYLERVTPEG